MSTTTNRLELKGWDGLCVQLFTEESLLFQEKLIKASGLGEETYLPISASSKCILTVFPLLNSRLWDHIMISVPCAAI